MRPLEPLLPRVLKEYRLRDECPTQRKLDSLLAAIQEHRLVKERTGLFNEDKALYEAAGQVEGDNS